MYSRRPSNPSPRSTHYRNDSTPPADRHLGQRDASRPSRPAVPPQAPDPWPGWSAYGNGDARGASNPRHSKPAPKPYAYPYATSARTHAEPRAYPAQYAVPPQPQPNAHVDPSGQRSTHFGQPVNAAYYTTRDLEPDMDDGRNENRSHAAPPTHARYEPNPANSRNKQREDAPRHAQAARMRPSAPHNRDADLPTIPPLMREIERLHRLPLGDYMLHGESVNEIAELMRLPVVVAGAVTDLLNAHGVPTRDSAKCHLEGTHRLFDALSQMYQQQRTGLYAHVALQTGLELIGRSALLMQNNAAGLARRGGADRAAPWTLDFSRLAKSISKKGERVIGRDLALDVDGKGKRVAIFFAK